MSTDLQERVVTTVATPAAGAMGVLAAVLRRRALHPVGVACSGTWTAADDTLPFVQAPEPWPVVVRLSKGAGLPGPVPDVLGLAIRIVSARGADQHADLLLSSTAGSGRLGQHLLRPTWAFDRARYSSLAGYETPIGRGTLWARAEVLEPGPAPHTLAAAAEAALAGRLVYEVGITTATKDHLLATVRLHEPLTPEEAEGLRFDPRHGAPGLVPADLLNDLRGRAYDASQRFRPAPCDDADVTEAAVRREAT